MRINSVIRYHAVIILCRDFPAAAITRPDSSIILCRDFPAAAITRPDSSTFQGSF